MTHGDATDEAHTSDPPACVFASTPASSSHRSRFFHGLVTGAWIANPLLLLVACAWVFLDGAFSKPAFLTRSDRPPPGSFAAFASLFHSDGLRDMLFMSKGRMNCYVLLVVAIGASLVTILVGLIFGAVRHRKLRSWLTLTTLVAAWAALWMNWHDVAWAGSRWRVARHIDAIEKVSAPLRAHWPQEDGDSPDLGPFSAYPQGNPGALMLLTQPPPGATALPFNQIERTPDGGLAFQLTENESGAFLEWHPNGKSPANFTGGLETRYTLLRSAPLHAGWFLTQYDAKILE